MTSAPIVINSSSSDLTSFINRAQSDTPHHDRDETTTAAAGGGGGKKVPGRVSSWKHMTEDELSAAMQEASAVHVHTIVISPIMHDYAVFRGSDIGICGGYVNPFPVFPWQLGSRKQAFVAGYRDMQRRIRNPKILDPSRSQEVREEVIRSGLGDGATPETVTVTKTIDSEDTILDLINYILYDSYAKDWKSPHFSMRIDGEFVRNHDAPQNIALTTKEIVIAMTLCLLFIGAMLWHPIYFVVSLVSVLAVGAVWIISYLLGVDRINREVERRHEEETSRDSASCCSSESDAGGDEEGEGVLIDQEEEEEEQQQQSSELVTEEQPPISSPVRSSAAVYSSSTRVLRSATKKQKCL
jgi:hypothetical protein